MGSTEFGILGLGFGIWASGLAAYGGNWRNNELAFHYLALWTGSDTVARAIAAAAVAAVLGFALARGTAPERATLLGFRTALLLSPVVHPWYLGWTLMFEPLKPSWPWLILSLTMILNYGVFATPAAGRARLERLWGCVFGASGSGTIGWIAAMAGRTGGWGDGGGRVFRASIAAALWG